MSGAVLAAVALAAALAGNRDGRDGDSSAADGASLVASLHETDWKYPPDESTGYRRLGSPLAAAELSHVAIGSGGTVAVSMQDRRQIPSVLAWRAGSWHRVSFPNHRAITAMAVDPAGEVYVGFAGGSVSRLLHDGTVDHQPAVRDGDAVVALAFDASSRRAALVLQGGQIHRGQRPLRTEDLQLLPAPEAENLRHPIYDGDGRLIVAGGEATVFASADDGWRERKLPGSARIRALGTGTDGAVLAAQQDGSVSRSSGASWQRVGRVPHSPLAVGELDGIGIAVVDERGRLYGSAEHPGLSEVSEHTRPDGGAHSAAIGAGAVTIVGARQWVVYDGKPWVSTTALGGDVPVTRCVPMGPRSSGADGSPPLLFSCDGDRYARLAGGRLRPVTQVPWDGHDVPAPAAAEALRSATRRRASWAGATPWVADATEGRIERWDAAKQSWTPVHRGLTGQEAVLSLSVFSGEHRAELWAVSHDDTVRFARWEPHPSTDTIPVAEVVEHRELEAHFGDGWTRGLGRIHALGGGRALLVYEGRDAAELRIEEDGDRTALEPPRLELPSDAPTRHRLQLTRIGMLTLASHDGRIFELSSDGTLQRWQLPEEISVDRVPFDSGPLDFAADGDGTVVMRARDAHGSALLACRERRCGVLQLPDPVRARGAAFADGSLVVWEHGGGVGLLPHPHADG